MNDDLEAFIAAVAALISDLDESCESGLIRHKTLPNINRVRTLLARVKR